MPGEIQYRWIVKCLFLSSCGILNSFRLKVQSMNKYKKNVKMLHHLMSDLKISILSLDYNAYLQDLRNMKTSSWPYPPTSLLQPSLLKSRRALLPTCKSKETEIQKIINPFFTVPGLSWTIVISFYIVLAFEWWFIICVEVLFCLQHLQSA